MKRILLAAAAAAFTLTSINVQANPPQLVCADFADPTVIPNPVFPRSEQQMCNDFAPGLRAVAYCLGNKCREGSQYGSNIIVMTDRDAKGKTYPQRFKFWTRGEVNLISDKRDCQTSQKSNKKNSIKKNSIAIRNPETGPNYCIMDVNTETTFSINYFETGDPDDTGACVRWIECAEAAFADPDITPSSGGGGSVFEIYDDNSRLEEGDYAVFYLGGTDPLGEFSFPSFTTWVAPTGVVITGRVPDDAPAIIMEVAVVSAEGQIRFAGLKFDVTAGGPPPPTITPHFGRSGSAITIHDPQSRIREGDYAVFYLAGTNPLEDGVLVPAGSIPSNSDKLYGIVPNVPAGQYYVAVIANEGPIKVKIKNVGFNVTPF